ncbi:Chemotaxis response regulator protein-glutamate methylesterase [Planctomycetes bacterium LzC2]|uniref:Chemotaxis response regulator protein-glutamate methylesterase n=1 Tax=Alienimonas chondri TaxID=2681879 RepID=A0ABX1V826_9PLAN|nr:Chemotaxis response regulator protein-glutamate methylesterase [Alienimonas chondri]
MVGIGASAGGLEALERVFRAMPADTGMAFVIVQHLAMEHRSMMPELAAKWTAMPVRQAEDRIALRGDHIYLLPPGKEMILSENRLLLTDRDPDQTLSLPIDRFFASLARDRGRHAIAVVLSGTGSDGSRGLVRVRDAGGLVIAQTADTAEFDGMPRSALDTGAVHVVLAPEKVGPTLAEFSQCPDIDAVIESARPVKSGGEGLTRVFELLREAYGIDFADYKISTVSRRTERRILLGRATDLDDYVDQLENDPEELSRLYHDLLIGVTEFFRDPEAWAAFSEAIKTILERKEDGEEVRVWSAGCAAGPEAYTLAIVLAERMRRSGRELPVKVFATDVHRESLNAAGAGEYDADALAKLPAELRDRYFTESDGGRMRVRPELRRNVVFSSHSIIKDPPFTRLDAICCRNVLIYLQTPAQRKAISLFHFGLKAGGLMLMGGSESPGELTSEFESIGSHEKLFRKRRDVNLHRTVRSPLSGGGAGGGATTRADALARRLALTVPRSGRGAGDRLTGYYDVLLGKFIPPAMLVGSDRRLLHTFGGAGSLLQQPDGRQTDDLFARLPADLRATAAGGFQRALRDGKEVAFRAVPVPLPGSADAATTTVHFTPVTHPDDGDVSAVLIRFAPETAGSPEVGANGGADEAPAAAPVEQFVPQSTASDDAEAERLREELNYTRENLNALVEELEASNEELQTTNEELISTNEEMQSTNEELNSVNEELYSLNAEYQAKIRELTELSDDVENLLRSTDVHTVFLDGELRVRKFTPRAAELFNLVDSDVGRRFDSFRHRIDVPDLAEDLAGMLEDGTTLEKEVRGPHGEPYLLRVLPYRNDVDGSDSPGTQEAPGAGGAVLTLVDIHALRQAEQRFTIALRASGRAMVLADAGGRVVLATPVAAKLFGAGDADELVGTKLSDRLTEGDFARLKASGAGADGGGVPVDHAGMTALRVDGATFPVAVSVARADEADGTYLLATFVDTGGRDALEQKLERKQHELQAVLENSRAAVFIKDLDGRYELTNSFLEDLAGNPEGGMVGKTDADLWPPAFAARYREHDLRVIKSGQPEQFEEQTENGREPRSFLSLKFPVCDAEGRVIATGGVATDITAQKRQTQRAEAALSQRDTFLAMLSHELRNPLAAVTGGLRLLDGPGGDAQRDWVEGMVRRQVGQLSRLTDDLLDVSRVSRGRIELKRAWTDLRAVAERAVEAVGDRFADRGQTVSLELPDDHLAVDGDGNRLEQIVVNLLTNAARYSETGDETAVVVRRDRGDAVLEVRDEGRGIDEDLLEEIFGLFDRGIEVAGKAEGGLGVGLTLARQLAELHGGSLVAASDGVGSGSTFTLRVKATNAPVPPGRDRGGEPVLGPTRVLVVDDNVDFARGLGAFFLDLGHLVRVENDGAAAPPAARQFKPDLVLLDLGLPGLTGWEVAAQLRVDPQFDRTAILAISGYGQEEDRRRSAEAGIDAHLTKPVDHDELLRAAAARLAARRKANRGEVDRDERPAPAVITVRNADDEGAGVRMLVIEDDRAMRLLLERMAERIGATVVSAADGAAALAADRAAENGRWNLVLCDLTLPGGMDGCDVGRALADAADAREMQARDAGEPVAPRPLMYAVSSHDEETWRDRVQNAGFDGFIQKPVSHDRLRELIQSAATRLRPSGRPALQVTAEVELNR